MIEGVRTVVYIKPDSFDSAANREMAAVVSRINSELSAQGEGYILIGPGRWGSSDELWAYRYTGRYIAGPSYCRGIAARLPYRAESGHSLLPQSNFVRGGVLYRRPGQRLRSLRQRIPRFAACRVREPLPAGSSFCQSSGGSYQRQTRSRCGDKAGYRCNSIEQLNNNV